MSGVAPAQYCSRLQGKPSSRLQQWRKRADPHDRTIQQRVRNREGNQPAKSQIQKRLEDRVWQRSQQSKGHVLRIKGQRYENMLEPPDERHTCDRQARTPEEDLEAGQEI